jgi:hypothetical protein
MEPFSSVDGAVCAETLDGDCDEVHKGLNRKHVKSPVRTNGELYQTYRTWEHPRRCIEATFQQLNGALFIRGRGRMCRDT